MKSGRDYHDEPDRLGLYRQARCWLDGRDVMLLGNARTGSFLAA
jgi:hypothetical protein